LPVDACRAEPGLVPQDVVDDARAIGGLDPLSMLEEREEHGRST
jgi:hypothetical protein